MSAHLPTAVALSSPAGHHPGLQLRACHGDQELGSGRKTVSPKLRSNEERGAGKYDGRLKGLGGRKAGRWEGGYSPGDLLTDPINTW